MHGTPLTRNEIAATLAREVAGLRRLGVDMDGAISAVANRHSVPRCDVVRLLLRQRRIEQLQADTNQAVA